MKTNSDILILKQLSGNASEAEQAFIKAWCQQSPANQEAYNQLKQIWLSAENLKQNPNQDVNEAWANFKELAKTKPRQSAKPLIYSIAAAIILMAVMGILLNLLPAKPETVIGKVNKTVSPVKKTPLITSEKPVIKHDSIKLAEVKAKPIIYLNQIKTQDSAVVFLLPDSSKVYLNKNSKLVYTGNYGKKDRKVVLEGEAFFEVHPSNKPFLVACGKTIIHDISTSFNVKGGLKDSLVEVNVISGAVEFYNEKGNKQDVLLLKEGSRGVYHVKAASFEKTKQKKGSKWWKAKGIKNKIREYIDKLKHKKH